MWLECVLIIVESVFGFLAFVALVLFGASFTKGQREKFPILRKLDGKQLHLFLFLFVFGLIAYGTNAWKDMVITKASFEPFKGLYREKKVF